jgi:hypothetical protein
VAAGISVNSEDLGATSIEVPDKDGAVADKPFKDCTSDELRLAIQRKRNPASGKALPPEVQALVEHYHEAVTDRFPADVPSQVTARDHKGLALFTFKDIPGDELDGLAEILMERGSSPGLQGKKAAEEV